MFYRALVVGIVVFWLTMVTLLIRVETAPDRANAMPVPVAYVWKLMFLHEEPSDLVLYNGSRERIGTLHLQPRHLVPAPGGSNPPLYVLTITGGFSFSLPGATPGQRLALSGTLQMNDDMQVQRFDVKAGLHEPKERIAATTFQLDGVPSSGRLHYALRRSGLLVKENSGTPATLLDDPDLGIAGFDPNSLTQMGQHQAAATSVTAHRGTLHMSGETLETFVVVVRQAGSLETTIHVSQLGQILAVKTFAGYDLYDETMTP